MGKKIPEGGEGIPGMINIDEFRRAQGLPVPTPEERAERNRQHEVAQAARRERAAEAERQILERGRAAEAARTEAARALETALRAEDPVEFQRAVVAVVPRFDVLTPSQRNALGAKFDGMLTRAVAGTVEELTALNVLSEKLRGWKRSEEERIAGGPQAFRIPKKEEPAKPPEPKTLRENALALLPAWARKLFDR